MKIVTVVVAVACAVGCATAPDGTMVLKYHDFGPQVAAYGTIGMECWQWENHGDPAPGHQYDVHVVVYRDVPLELVQQAYPVMRDKEQDYRYLPYGKALAYLDERIQENILPELTAKLRETKSRIEKQLGKSSGTRLIR